MNSQEYEALLATVREQRDEAKRFLAGVTEQRDRFERERNSLREQLAAALIPRGPDATIEVGDVVQLKSGGPRMTVYEVDDMSACCDYFDGKGRARNTAFENAVLVRGGAVTKADDDYRAGLLAEFLDEHLVANNRATTDLWDAACVSLWGDAYRTMPTDQLIAAIRERARQSRAKRRGLLQDVM